MAIDDHLINTLDKLVDAYGAAETLSGLGFVFGERSGIAPKNAREGKNRMRLSAELDRITALAEEVKL